MTTRQGIDYSFARPGGKAIKDAGKEFVMRYIPYSGDQGKGLTLDELDDLRANGLAVGLVFETTAGRALAGGAAGQFDAGLALTAANALGFPDDQPIYFAVDFDAQPSDFALIDAYLMGASWVLGAERVGVYGSHAVIEHCHATSTAAFFWQTYGWSGGKKSSLADIYQYQNGVFLATYDDRGVMASNSEVDLCEAYGNDVGLWEPEEEDELSDADKARLDRLEALIGGNGLVIDGKRLTGNDALEAAYKAGWSAFLGIGQLRDGLAAIPASSGPVGPHTHQMSETGPVV